MKKTLLFTLICLLVVLTACGAKAEPETNGILSTFTATDLDGNTVDQSILEGYDLTMINIWGTFCGPCLREMPDLGELAVEYKDKGVQIIGLVSDTIDAKGQLVEEQVEKAREAVEKTGANYIHLLPSQDLLGILSQVYGVPTTFFVDSQGNQIGIALVKSMSKEQWIQVIDEKLEEIQK